MRSTYQKLLIIVFDKEYPEEQDNNGDRGGTIVSGSSNESLSFKKRSKSSGQHSLQSLSCLC